VASGLPTVGYWSLMDVGNLVGNAVTLPSGTAVYATGILPPAVDPYQKRLVYDDMPAAPEPDYGVEVPLGDIEENFTVYKVPLSGENTSCSRTASTTSTRTTSCRSRAIRRRA
jgi:hypothetical protein